MKLRQIFRIVFFFFLVMSPHPGLLLVAQFSIELHLLQLTIILILLTSTLDWYSSPPLLPVTPQSPWYLFNSLLGHCRCSYARRKSFCRSCNAYCGVTHSEILWYYYCWRLCCLWSLSLSIHPSRRASQAVTHLQGKLHRITMAWCIGGKVRAAASWIVMQLWHRSSRRQSFTQYNVIPLVLLVILLVLLLLRWW